MKEGENSQINFYDCIIVGGGPAGLTAGLYLSRYRIDAVLFEKGFSGGQVNLSETIENYPGFPDGILGPELMQRFEQQATKFGLKIVNQTVEELFRENNGGKVFFKIRTSQDNFFARSIIISSGGEANRLGVPGEKDFIGKGVSYCGTCDGAFFRNKEIAVVGGGDTALEEALLLTKFASKVTIIHRRDQLRGTRILQERTFENPKISFIWNSIVTSIDGNTQVESLQLKDVKTNQEITFPCQGIFIFTGYKPVYPSLGSLKEQLTDQKGYIITDQNMQTQIEGIFACGDVRAKNLRQIVTACGEGASAAFSVEAYLN